ncbi:hypothetical protein CK501_11550 [Halovibrio salipaludis]|uniref:Uncharacterized protein n=1 Tax=Halovibrio salipaludis TaxID=2032626 RepID=A0A2A2F5C1_9GAMM|nr:ECF transporter S component [Halovibrio salipaludis]PAU79829.1 hypothetical protein CK501_11550 [Halovibrio salipaludis]
MINPIATTPLFVPMVFLIPATLFGLAAMLGACAKSLKANAFVFVIAFIPGLIIAYFAMPTLAWGFAGILFYLLLPLFVFRYTLRGRKSRIRIRSRSKVLDLVPVAALIAVVGVMFVTTHGIFNSHKWRNLLEVTEQKEFDPSDVLLDQTEARTVDQALASRSANELLGNTMGMGSRYDISPMRIQKYDDGLYWVAPFAHKSIWRWLSDATIPGYVTVSASSYSDSRMVTDDRSEINVGMQGFYAGDYLPRYLYRNGYSTVGLSGYTLELDPAGKPHWVVSIVAPQIGFGGYAVQGVVVVDARSREISEYDVDEVPGWIDRIQPYEVVQTQIAGWGQYVDGWLNKAFIGESIVEPTPGSLLVYTRDGDAAWYTGARSQNDSGQGTMGFFLTDSRTGETTFYRRSGITEQAAQSTLEGLVQEYDYTATLPIPYNVQGVSTFISILKDESGNPQQIGMVAYDDRSVAAVGKTVEGAMRGYTEQLNEADQDINLEEGAEPMEISGVLARVGFQHSGDTATMHFTLSEADREAALDRVFSVTGDGGVAPTLSEAGDRVVFTVRQLERRQVTARDFRNRSLDIEGSQGGGRDQRK